MALYELDRSATEAEKRAFIEELGPIVLQKVQENGYNEELAEVILAQFCYETGFGINELCTADTYNVGAIKPYAIAHDMEKYNLQYLYDSENKQIIPAEDAKILPGQRWWCSFTSYEDAVQYYMDYTRDQMDSNMGSFSADEYIRAMGKYKSNSYDETYPAGMRGRMSDEVFQEVFKEVQEKYENGEYGDTTSSDDDTVSVDYQFVTNYVNSIISLIANSSIINSDAVGIATSGSATFKAANDVFNSYANKSVEFLNSLGTTCGNILTMADSLSKLDNALANAAMNEMTSVDLSSFNEFYDNIPNIDFLAGYRGEDGTLKITKDNLISAMSESNAIISSLINDISDTQELKAELDSFISESKGNLQGDAWDKMRNVVGEYSDTCQKKIDYCNNLMESMQIAYRKLLDHMEEFDELDMSKMGEIIQGISDMTTQINNLTALINSTPDFEDIYGLDENGRTVKIGTKDNRALKASWENMRNVCEEIKDRLEKNLLKLEQLPGVDADAADEILQAETEEPDSPETTPITTPSPGSIDSGELETDSLDSTPSQVGGSDSSLENAESSGYESTPLETPQNEDNTGEISAGNDQQQSDSSQTDGSETADTQSASQTGGGSPSTGGGTPSTGGGSPSTGGTPSTQTDSINNTESTVADEAVSQNIEPVSTIPSDQNVSFETYNIVSGDTLSEIAKKHGISLEELLKYNPDIENPDLIFVGQKVNLPSYFNKL